MLTCRETPVRIRYVSGNPAIFARSFVYAQDKFHA